MQSTQGNGLVLGGTPILELPDSPKEPGSASTHRTEIVRRRSTGVGSVFQLLATAYAVAMLVITLRVYTSSPYHPGPTFFFIASTASFYIICYNALSVEQTFRLWLERHYPALRRLSIVVAVVLATFPTGVLYRMRSDGAKPTPSASATPSTVTALPASVGTKEKPVYTVKSHETVGEHADPIMVLSDVQYWSGPSSTTVAIDVDETVRYEIKRLTNPDRIYLDLRGSKLDIALWGRKFRVKDPLLQAIRVAEHEGNVTRVTLETKLFCEYLLTTVPKSRHLQIELRRPAGQSWTGETR